MSKLAKAPRVLKEPACCSCSSLRVSVKEPRRESSSFTLRFTIGVI
jgi:hypothetical protein